MIHDNYREWDLRHVWHPYTDIKSYENKAALCIDSADGVNLYDINGRSYMDGIASWWTISLGHNNRAIVEAIQAQSEQLQHVMLGGMTHPRAVELARRLAELAPGELNHVYYASDGSSVVDAALKMAAQYWQLKGKPQKHRFIGMENAYHGDTLGAIGVGFTSWFREPYGILVRQAIFAPSPHARSVVPVEISAASERALSEMKTLLEKHHHEVAAIIVEPLCQGSAGIRFYPPEYLSSLRALCDVFNVLLIVDEIATGFYRCGAAFACDVAGVVPDIMCLGKSLTGGYLPLSAAMVTDKVYDMFRSPNDEKRVLWDGHTFCGNPIACAAALAALSEYERLGFPKTLREKEKFMAEAFTALNAAPQIEYARSLGMIGMCAFREESGGAKLATQVAAAALDLGLHIRPLGEVIYLWPPLTATLEELQAMIARIAGAMEKSIL